MISFVKGNDVDQRECGELGALPLPEGERVGVRGIGSIERP
jgi:hypothetical protein